MPDTSTPLQLISFNAAMLAAVRSGRKSVTRRRFSAKLAINEWPDRYQFKGMEDGVAMLQNLAAGAAPVTERISCPFGRPGDLLRVQEDPTLVLEILTIRAEQIRAITEAEALAEGVEPRATDPPTQSDYSAGARAQGSAVAAFQALIDAIYPTAWARNEWVWVLAFRRVPGPAGQIK